MKIKVKNVPNLVLPKYANPDDACLDIIATTDPVIVGEEISSGVYKSIDYIEYGTGLFMTPEDDITYDGILGPRTSSMTQPYFIELRPRSSISKYNLILANSPATGDKNYTGKYKIRFKYLMQPCDFRIYTSKDESDTYGSEIYANVDYSKIYKLGDKICQMRVVQKHSINFEIVDELENTKRGSGGFGSSGV